MSTPAPHLMNCPTCAQPTELPFLFCDHCGMPRVKLGHWRLVLNLSLAFLTFTNIYLAKDYLSWAWPLYLYFWIFYIQFGLMLMAGRAWLKMRLFFWNMLFLLVFFFMFHFMQDTKTNDFLFSFMSPGQPLAPDFLMVVVGSLPSMARDFPIPFFSALGGTLVFVFGLSYIKWGRKYGWVNAYRIVMLSLLSICFLTLGGLELAQYLHRAGYWPTLDWNDLLKDKALFDEYLGLVTVNLWRVFVFEIVIYSAFHSYALVHRTPMPRIDFAPGESALVRSLLRVVAMLQRLYKVLEQMCLYLLSTLWLLACDLLLVVKAFLRELALPTISLIATALMFYALMHSTMTYIETDQVLQIVKIVALLAGTLLSLMVFVACKTPYRWKRVLSFYGEMLAWILPNLLVFFLLMSVSLWMTSIALSKNPAFAKLPYQPRLLTGILGAVMAVMVVVIVVRKRGLIAQPPPEPVPVAPVKAVKEKKSWSLPMPGKVRERYQKIADSTRQKLDDMRIDEHAKAMKDMAGDAREFLKDRMKHKPLVVDKLDRAAERYQAKVAQITTLSNMRSTVDTHTYERLMGQYRGELGLLKTELDQVTIEYRSTLAKRQEELVGLKAEESLLAKRKDEIEKLREAGVLNDQDYKREQRALDAKLRAVQARVESCQAILDSMATGAMQ